MPKGKRKNIDDLDQENENSSQDDLVPEDIPLLRAASFSKHYGTRILSMTTEYDFRLLLANEKMMDDDENEFYIGETMWILTPNAAKEIFEDLKTLLKEWEKEMGKIKPRTAETKYSEQVL
jgi:hypothetical protein